MEKSSRRFVAGMIALMMMVSSFSFVPHNASAATQTGVMVALYTYPGSTWDSVAQAKAAHPSVPVVAIINPNNGPGGSRDANYVTGIQKLHAAGVVVIGYDATGYTSRGVSAVEADINTWKSLYSVDGIFFDEMSNVAGDENFYSTVSAYAHGKGYGLTVGNPGTDTLPSFIGTVDNIMIYENPGLPPISALQGWHTSYDKKNFSMIAFGVSSVSQSFLTSASNYVGYIDLTNDNLPNPYDTLPSYFGTLVADLDTGSAATAPQPPTGLAATAASSSQINLSWSAPANNGGSAITGYKIQRSTDGGATWTNLVANTASTSTAYSDTGLGSATSYSYRVFAINSVGTSSASNVASATTGGIATVPQPPTGLTSVAASSSQINLSWTASGNGGSPITGYEIEQSVNSSSSWSVLVPSTASSATTYSSTGLAAHTSYTYRVSAINSVGTSLASNTASATTPIASSGGGTVSVLVSSVDLSGAPITGMWVELHASNGTTVATGYTPVTFSVSSGTTYTVVSSNYQNYVFNHWDDGTTSASRTITPTQNTSLTEYYSTAITLKVKTVDLAGNPITGLWATISSNGVVVAKGYTPLSYSATPGTSYTVSVANYQNYVFDHWSNGSTNPVRTVTPTANLSLLAYYNN